MGASLGNNLKLVKCMFFGSSYTLSFFCSQSMTAPSQGGSSPSSSEQRGRWLQEATAELLLDDSEDIAEIQEQQRRQQLNMNAVQTEALFVSTILKETPASPIVPKPFTTVTHNIVPRSVRSSGVLQVPIAKPVPLASSKAAAMATPSSVPRTSSEQPKRASSSDTKPVPTAKKAKAAPERPLQKAKTCCCTARDCDYCGRRYISNREIRRSRSPTTRTSSPSLHQVVVSFPLLVNDEVASASLRRLKDHAHRLAQEFAPCRLVVGITHHPVWRWYSYWRLGAWRMFVVHVSSEASAVEWAETVLIDYWKTNLQQIYHNVSCTNVRPGGEGPMRQFDAPYYLYFAVFDAQWSGIYKTERSKAQIRAPDWWKTQERIP